MYELNKDTDLSLVKFTNDYIEGMLDKTEQTVFEEYLSSDSELNFFVQKSLQGKQMLRNAFSVCAADDFEEKLAKRIAREKQSKSSCNSADLASA